MRPRALRDEDRRAIATWRYAGRDAIYDTDGEITADAGREALVDATDGRLVGFVCHGAEARVPGLAPVDGVVDLGVGLRPELVGGGWGAAVTAAALDVARRAAPRAHTARAVVLEWNERSQRTLRGAGFVEHPERVVTPDGRRFVVFHRPLDGPTG